MRAIFLISFVLVVAIACQDEKQGADAPVIAAGQMPALAKDNAGNIHLVYGNGDSVLYAYSADEGKTFSSPALIAVVPQLAASHMRGPQIAATSKGLVVTACNEPGNVFAFARHASGGWSQPVRVNDVDTMAKENLMALSSDADNVFAVWLDLRDGHNKIFGARSTDGGKSWSRNIMVYASPDTTVCECCKPSVAVKGNNVYVMFRNWLHGNRDLYLVRSADAGDTFGQAEKLGTGSWALKGCPMDGGGLAINENGTPETVWRRETTIYAAEPGKAEINLGKGKSCTIESVNGKNVYAWVEGGNIIVLKPQGKKANLGKGQLPVIRAVNNEHLLCVWEFDKQIHKAIIEL